MAGSSFYEQLLSATGKGTPNYSLFAVPAMWVLAMLPHFYAAAISKGQFDNVSPRGYLADVQNKAKKTATDKAYIRAEACQQNSHENLPFFAAALIVGNMAKLPSEELNALAGAYLASRIAYTFLYLFVTSDALANLRSVSYLVGIGINSTLFVKAAIALK